MFPTSSLFASNNGRRMAQFNVPANPLNPQMLEIVTYCDVVEADGSSQAVDNVYHFAGRPGNPGAPNLTTVLASFVSWHNAAVAPALSADYASPLAGIRMLDDPTMLEILSNPGDMSDGSISGDRLPTFNAVSVDVLTDSRGRCFRGRKHYGPIGESGTTMDEITGTTLTAFNALISALEPHLTLTDGANTFDFCVLSRINSNLIGPSIYFTFAQQLHALLSIKIGTMKRRKEGVGA